MSGDTLEPAADGLPLELDAAAVAEMRRNGTALGLLDVREGWELDICRIDGSLHIPMGELPGRLDELPRGSPLVVLCHHGMRSMQVTQWLRQSGFQAINLGGGIDAWARNVDPTLSLY